MQSAFWKFQTITVSECCLIKLLSYILFEKCINILALEMTSPENQHCANCIGTLSFPIGRILLMQCCGLKGSPYSITERRVPELIPVLGSQPAGDVSHKPGGRLPFLSARPAVPPATLERPAANSAASWTEARWVWTVCLRLLPDRVATAIWTQALLRLSPARWPLGYRATQLEM